MDILEISFQADVWGNVSEWVMIIVTIVTAYFLYKTLQSQREVQHAQNKLLEIEQLKLREDYKPVLRFEPMVGHNGEIWPFIQLTSDEEVVSIAVFYNSHLAHKIKFTLKESPINKTMTQRLNLSTSEDNYKVSLHFITSKVKNHPLCYMINFECEYYDISNNGYIQNLNCYKFDGEEMKIGMFPAKMIITSKLS